MTTQQQVEERGSSPLDTTGVLKFVTRPDDITLDDDPNTLRLEMSCGHAVTPESLTQWCRSLLDQSQYKFICPAIKDGTVQKCGVEWPYREVRLKAILTPEEMVHFEETLAHLAATKYCEFKQCPGCKSFIERQDLSNLSVRCTICSQVKHQVYEFCWQCQKQWKGQRPRSDRCDNDGCTNLDLELLQKCPTTPLPQVEGVNACPSIRVCPTCGQRVEHDKTGCKNILCPRCQVEFCFVCLKLKPICLQTSSYYRACSAGVAPRQTSIPVWHRN